MMGDANIFKTLLLFLLAELFPQFLDGHILFTILLHNLQQRKTHMTTISMLEARFDV